MFFLTGMEYCGNYAYKLDLFKLFILCWKVFVTVLLCKIKIMYLWHIYFLITSGVLQTLSFVSFLSWFLFLLNNVRFRVMLIVRWPFWLQLMVNLLGGQNFNRRFQKKRRIKYKRSVVRLQFTEQRFLITNLNLKRFLMV